MGALAAVVASAGCRGHEYGVLQPETACQDCSPGDQIHPYVDRGLPVERQPKRQPAVTPNSPPAVPFVDVYRDTPEAGNPNSETPPAIRLTPPMPVPVPAEEPEKLEPFPPDPPELPTNTRFAPIPRRKPSGDRYPPVAEDIFGNPIRKRSPVLEPVQSQQRLVPRSTKPDGFFQQIGNGWKNLLRGKPAGKPSVTSTGNWSRHDRYLSRNAASRRSVAWKSPRKKLPSSRMIVRRSNPPPIAARVASAEKKEKTVLKVQPYNPVLLQVPQSIPGKQRSLPAERLAQQPETADGLPAPLDDEPHFKPESTDSHIAPWPYRSVTP